MFDWGCGLGGVVCRVERTGIGGWVLMGRLVMAVYIHTPIRPNLLRPLVILLTFTPPMLLPAPAVVPFAVPPSAPVPAALLPAPAAAYLRESWTAPKLRSAREQRTVRTMPVMRSAWCLFVWGVRVCVLGLCVLLKFSVQYTDTHTNTHTYMRHLIVYLGVDAAVPAAVAAEAARFVARLVVALGGLRAAVKRNCGCESQMIWVGGLDRRPTPISISIYVWLTACAPRGAPGWPSAGRWPS